MLMRGWQLEVAHSDGSDCVMRSNLASWQPGGMRAAKGYRSRNVLGNRGKEAGCGARASRCHSSSHRVALAVVISVVLAVVPPTMAMGAPPAMQDDLAPMLPKSVSAESALGREMLRHWMPRNAVALDSSDYAGQVTLERRPVPIPIMHAVCPDCILPFRTLLPKH